MATEDTAPVKPASGRVPPSNPIIGRERADAWDRRFDRMEVHTKGISDSFSVMNEDITTLLNGKASNLTVLAMGAVVVLLQAVILFKIF